MKIKKQMVQQGYTHERKADKQGECKSQTHKYGHLKTTLKIIYNECKMFPKSA